MARRQSGLVLCLLAFAGCSGDDESATAPTRSTSVAEAAQTLRQEHVQVRVTRTGTIPNAGDFSFEGEGTMAGDGSRGVMRGELIDVEDQELDVEVRFHGKDTWTGAEQLRGRLPDGAAWIHAADVLTVDRALTPWFLADVLAATHDVDEVGEKQVEGAAAIHYRGLVEARPLLKLVPEIATGRAGTDLPVDLWLADGRLKRLRLDYKAYPASFFMDAVVTGNEKQPIPEPPAKADTVEIEELGG